MRTLLSLFSLLLILSSCQNPGAKDNATDDTVVELKPVSHPEWSKNASIYEVNIRQHSAEGTFASFEKDLPRLQRLGVKILWIMPIQPIGELKRKGGLGSYYSIQDYKATNPEFGSMDDFKSLVNKAHEMDFKVILDWVANHTAWDNIWMEDHPDWYTRNDSGKVIPPVEDWSDVADLNYDNKDMRAAMLEAMRFWIKEANVDGYRCDVGMMVPMDFWNTVRMSLDSLKPVFMLAEAEGPEFHQHAFDMTYGWEFHHLMNEVAKGNETVEAFDNYQAKMDTTYSNDAYRMFFTTNHDENSWNGTVYERMADNHLNFFVLATTFPNGMPLIYSGQEARLNKRLAFFEKDTIEWSDTTLYSFYEKMIHLKSTHPALMNGKDQGSFERLPNENLNAYGYIREAKNGEKLMVLLNFGKEKVEWSLADLIKNNWTDVVSDTTISLDSSKAIELSPNSFLVLTSGENN